MVPGFVGTVATDRAAVSHDGPELHVVDDDQVDDTPWIEALRAEPAYDQLLVYGKFTVASPVTLRPASRVKSQRTTERTTPYPPHDRASSRMWIRVGVAFVGYSSSSMFRSTALAVNGPMAQGQLESRAWAHAPATHASIVHGSPSVRHGKPSGRIPYTHRLSVQLPCVWWHSEGGTSHAPQNSVAPHPSAT